MGGQKKRQVCADSERGIPSAWTEILLLWCSHLGLFLVKIGLSGVRALPLGIALKRSLHYICDFFFSFLRHILFSQKGLS